MRLGGMTSLNPEILTQPGVAKTVLRWWFIVLVMLLTGCARTMMLPPGIYTADEFPVFDQLDPTLAKSRVDIIYLTDRLVEIGESGAPGYGTGRSTSLAFGEATVEIGRDLSWGEIVAFSKGTGSKPTLNLVGVEERGRFPATPYVFDIDASNRLQPVPEIAAELQKAQTRLESLLRERLAKTDSKEAFVHVHGVGNDFEDAMQATAELWHFLGRRGVPIAYSWPAGAEGLFFYTIDRESGEFTVLHLKQLLKVLARFSEVEKIHLLAHSRGTDVVMTALRELIIETRAAGQDPRDVLKVENVVLAAPDIDLEVALQRIAGEALGKSYGRLTVYTNPNDEAIAAAKTLFHSRIRVGALEPSRLTDEQKRLLARDSNLDVLIYKGSGGGLFQHSYFRDPKVSSDVVLLLRYGYAAGEGGRSSLQPLGDNLWSLGAAVPP